MAIPSMDAVRIAVIGLGYVGLPLSVYLGREFPVVVGFDINPRRISELRNGTDRTLEVTVEELKLATRLSYSSSPADLATCNFFIVAVPTPIDEAKRPDLTPLVKASETIAKVIRPGSIVVYESTVCPGAAEEVCIPVIEKISGLKFDVDFFAGYSSERVNPADPQRRLPNIKKITSGSTPDAADFIDKVYARVITAGKTDQRHFTLPNKLFEYIGAGLAVAVSPAVDLRAVVESHGVGVVSRDAGVEAIADTINGLTRDQVAGFKAAARRAAQTLCWECERGAARGAGAASAAAMMAGACLHAEARAGSRASSSRLMQAQSTW